MNVCSSNIISLEYNEKIYDRSKVTLDYNANVSIFLDFLVGW